MNSKPLLDMLHAFGPWVIAIVAAIFMYGRRSSQAEITTTALERHEECSRQEIELLKKELKTIRREVDEKLDGESMKRESLRKELSAEMMKAVYTTENLKKEIKRMLFDDDSRALYIPRRECEKSKEVCHIHIKEHEEGVCRKIDQLIVKWERATEKQAQQTIDVEKRIASVLVSLDTLIRDYENRKGNGG